MFIYSPCRLQLLILSFSLIYLICKTEGKAEREKEWMILHLLVHTLNDHNSQVWSRLKTSLVKTAQWRNSRVHDKHTRCNYQVMLYQHRTTASSSVANHAQHSSKPLPRPPYFWLPQAAVYHRVQFYFQVLMSGYWNHQMASQTGIENCNG